MNLWVIVSNRQWKSYDSIKKRVLYGYPGIDFEADEKPKWGPLEIEFFCWGGLRTELEGVRSLLKPSYAFLINKKLKIQNMCPDKRKVPKNDGPKRYA